MKLILSERLQMMADAVRMGDTAADIGTDHGYIPIWLVQNGKCENVILSDINSGPLRKAKENIGKFLPGRAFDMRQGSGISVLAPGEADTVIIAGMGGNLIRDILTEDPEKTLRIPRLVLQPRNHPELLRIWVRQTPPFAVRQELLAEEDGRLCEIIIAENTELTDFDAEDLRRRADAAERFRKCAGVPQDMTYELPMVYFSEHIRYGMEFLHRKAEAEERIIRRIEKAGMSQASALRLKESRERLAVFRRIEKCAGEGAASEL